MGRGGAHVDEARKPHRLAVVERLDLRELLVVALDRVGQRVHQPLAPGRGHGSPRPIFERLARRFDRPLDILGTGLGDPHDLPARGRVQRREGAPVGSLDALAADQEVLRTGEELSRGLAQRIRQGDGGLGGGGHGVSSSAF